jgi:hypothetical protein
MNYKFRLRNTTIVANCSPIYEEQINGLFNKLAELDKIGPAITNGSSIQFGWSRLLLKGNEDELIIYEPDFSGNPFKDYVPSIDNTLKILVEQAVLLNNFGIEGVTAKYSDKIVITKNCLSKSKIYLERTSSDEEDDSGWFIGEVDDINTDDSIDNYDVIYVFQLLNIRPTLMQVLVLPPGFLVVFFQDQLIQIFDNEGKNILV